jgi:predicted ferric reductase
MKIKSIVGWVILLGISFIPAVLLLALGPGDYSSITHTLGQIAGLIGMTMFALTFVLSCRFHIVDSMFDGLDKTYAVHSVIGATSLILILAHPILLVMNFIPDNINLAAKYLLPNKYWSVNYGIIALLGMVLLLVVTMYGKLKYNHWKISHKFFGLMFFFAVLHISLVKGEISRDYIFKGYDWYALIISVIGLSAFMYSSFLRKNFAGHAKYKIESIVNNNGIYDINLKPVGKPLHYHGGQFVFVSFSNNIIAKEQHPFSIASDPKNDNLRLGIKGLGDYTSKMMNLKIGDKVEIEGPYGAFYKSNKNSHIWIAGGIGITPFLGMVHELKSKVDLFYSVKEEKEFFHIDTFHEYEKSNPNFKIHKWVTNSQGYLNLDSIKKTVNISGRDFYICGPQSLKDSIINSLVKEGVSLNRIHFERFDFR